jgi:cytochrome c oxidase assembly protein subunit 11
MTTHVERDRANRSLLVKLSVVVVAMFGFGFALVPFYDKICQVTGLRNIDQADEVKSTQIDYARTVRIELDANTRNLPWTFRPLETLHPVHPGEIAQVVYQVSNNTDRRVIGQAVPSYGPQQAAQYFRKLECFCFTRQVLEPGETRKMPVVFVIDPALPKDIGTITLSYTFFEVEDGRGG